MSSSLMFRYWSTDLRVPRIEMSFLSSTVTARSEAFVSTSSITRGGSERIAGAREVRGTRTSPGIVAQMLLLGGRQRGAYYDL